MLASWVVSMYIFFQIVILQIPARIPLRLIELQGDKIEIKFLKSFKLP